MVRKILQYPLNIIVNDQNMKLYFFGISFLKPPYRNYSSSTRYKVQFKEGEKKMKTPMYFTIILLLFINVIQPKKYLIEMADGQKIGNHTEKIPIEGGSMGDTN